MPEEHQVIQMTDSLYDKLITDRLTGQPLNGDTPWIIVFINKENVDSKRAYQNYRRLAEYYQGKVRFAWVRASRNELLSAAFDARYLPQTFLIKDGTAYWYRDFPYEQILARYIDEGRYVNSTTHFK